MSISAIGPLDFRNIPFRERIDKLGKLAPRILDFLYEAYEQLLSVLPSDSQFADNVGKLSQIDSFDKFVKQLVKIHECHEVYL
jgi:hypothetical protein